MISLRISDSSNSRIYVFRFTKVRETEGMRATQKYRKGINTDGNEIQAGGTETLCVRVTPLWIRGNSSKEL